MTDFVDLAARGEGTRMIASLNAGVTQLADPRLAVSFRPALTGVSLSVVAPST